MDLLEEDPNDADREVMLALDIILTLILGILNLIGIVVLSNSAEKLVKFLANQRKLIQRIIEILVAAVTAGTITGAVLVDILKFMSTAGWLEKILYIVADFGFWGMALFLSNLAATIFFPGVKLAQMIASLAVLAIHVAVLIGELIALASEGDEDTAQPVAV